MPLRNLLSLNIGVNNKIKTQMEKVIVKYVQKIFILISSSDKEIKKKKHFYEKKELSND